MFLLIFDANFEECAGYLVLRIYSPVTSQAISPHCARCGDKFVTIGSKDDAINQRTMALSARPTRFREPRVFAANPNSRVAHFRA